MIRAIRKRIIKKKKEEVKVLNRPEIAIDIRYNMDTYYSYYNGSLNKMEFNTAIDIFLFHIRQRLLTGRKFITPIGIFTIAEFSITEGVDLIKTAQHRREGNIGVIEIDTPITKYKGVFLPAEDVNTHGYNFRFVTDLREELNRGGQFVNHIGINGLLV